MTYFFWVENLHTIFLGQGICFRLKKNTHIFLGLITSEVFNSGFRCDQWIRKIFIRTFFSNVCSGKKLFVFFWVGNFDARYSFGSKISGLCIFGVFQYEALSDPLSCIFRVPPGIIPRPFSYQSPNFINKYKTMEQSCYILIKSLSKN